MKSLAPRRTARHAVTASPSPRPEGSVDAEGENTCSAGLTIQRASLSTALPRSTGRGSVKARSSQLFPW